MRLSVVARFTTEADRLILGSLLLSNRIASKLAPFSLLLVLYIGDSSKGTKEATKHYKKLVLAEMYIDS